MHQGMRTVYKAEKNWEYWLDEQLSGQKYMKIPEKVVKTLTLSCQYRKASKRLMLCAA